MLDNPRRTGAGVAAALAMSLSLAAPAISTTAGANGRLTFMRPDKADRWQVWVADPDLSHQRRLTSGKANGGWPVWAPGGQRIAFDSDRNDSHPKDDTYVNDVFTMRPDGSDVQQLTHSRGEAGNAAYAPDGGRIAYDQSTEGKRRGGIFTMAATDGSHVRRVTRVPRSAESDRTPRFSPDGTRLVFTRYRSIERGRKDPPKEPAALFVVDADGTHLRRVTPFSLRAGDADWSPDGQWLTFETNNDEVDNYPADVYVVRPDGSELRNLTHNTARTGEGDTTRYTGSSDPVFSPDGRTILFSDAVYADKVFTSGLATMRPDGTGRAYLPRPRDEHQPDWEAR